MSDDDFVFNTGAAWADLLGTQYHSYGSRRLERLSSAARLGDWLSAVGLRPVAAPDDADLRLARQVRESLRRAVVSILGLPNAPEAPTAQESEETLRAILESPETGFRWNAAGVARVASPADVTEALGRIVRGALADLAHHAGDLHACDDPECAKIYLDPAGSRRYCGTRCATRVRVRNHRSREKALHASAAPDAAGDQRGDDSTAGSSPGGRRRVNAVTGSQ